MKIKIVIFAMLVGLYACAQSPKPEGYTRTVDGAVIEVKPSVKGVEVYVNNSMVALINAGGNAHSIGIYNGINNLFYLNFHQGGIEPIDVLRIITIDNKRYLLVYSQNGEVEKKTPME